MRLPERMRDHRHGVNLCQSVSVIFFISSSPDHFSVNAWDTVAGKLQDFNETAQVFMGKWLGFD